MDYASVLLKILEKNEYNSLKVEIMDYLNGVYPNISVDNLKKRINEIFKKEITKT